MQWVNSAALVGPANYLPKLFGMTLDDVLQVATDVIHDHAPDLEVLGVMTAEGGSDYAEIFLGVRDCAVELCRLIVGVDRSVSSEDLRAAILDKLNEHSQTAKYVGTVSKQ